MLDMDTIPQSERDLLTRYRQVKGHAPTRPRDLRAVETWARLLVALWEATHLADELAASLKAGALPRCFGHECTDRKETLGDLQAAAWNCRAAGDVLSGPAQWETQEMARKLLAQRRAEKGVTP